MGAIHLQSIIKKLSQGSIESVKNGEDLGGFGEYLHICRPVEDKLKEKMDDISHAGGGIVLLVGSAGDGKSHLISCARKNYPDMDFNYYNDATASCSPTKTAIETLREALVDFNDANLGETHKKMVLAINLGKLNAFIDDDYVKNDFKEIIAAANPIFDCDGIMNPSENARIKFVLFTNYQIFEFNSSDESDYPVSSIFLSEILDRIVDKTKINPFYQAYLKDKASESNNNDPLLINYELLCISEIRKSIVMFIIEAIIRFKLMITPREYMDFIYSMLCCSNDDSYDEKKDFYESLLPSLLFCGGDNRIQKALCNLDPLKSSNNIHNSDLSVLFTSYTIPKNYFDGGILAEMPQYMVKRIDKFYSNNGKDIERTTKFLFRLKHLLSYHSESIIYVKYLDVLRSIFRSDTNKMSRLYELVSAAIPRHSGSYYGKKNMIPLNIQGGKYKLFSKLSMNPRKIIPEIIANSDNEFLTNFCMIWKCPDSEVKLKVNYQLYEYIYKLNEGRLAISYDNDKDICFSRFIRQLVEQCDSMEEITVLTANNKELTLTESLGNISFE